MKVVASVSGRRIVAPSSQPPSSHPIPSAAAPVAFDRRAALLSAIGLVSLPALTASVGPAVAAQGPSTIDGQGRQLILGRGDEAQLSTTARQVLEYNKRIQRQNNAPDDFPYFAREGFDMTILLEGYVVEPTGLIIKDYKIGTGAQPADGQEVVFDYTAFNESGGKVDSSYRQGRPGQTRLGINGLIPGFELGIKGMKVGGRRRIVVPPTLGPPVGPSTFFSAKQYEVFDVELLAVRNCVRRQFLMTSDVVCEDVI